MNRYTNIFLKLFFILVLVGGWGGSAWAQTPEWYYMKITKNNTWISSASSYINANGDFRLISGVAKPTDYKGIWCIKPTGSNASDGKPIVHIYEAYDGEGMSMATLLNTSSTGAYAYTKMVEANNIPDNYSIDYAQHSFPAAGTCAFRSEGAGRTYFWLNNRDNMLAVWNSNNAITSNSGAGDIGSRFELTRVPNMGTAVKVVIVDGYGNPLSDVVVYTNAERNGVASTTHDLHNNDIYNFGDLPFMESLFRPATADPTKIFSVSMDEESNTLTLTIAEDPNLIKFSDAPSATGWAANTNWFTMRNNRTSYSGDGAAKWNLKYLTVTANGVRDDFSVTIENTPMNVTPTDRGGYWCFVGNTDGFKIQNAAYGPDFYFAYLGGNKYAMVHKDNIPAGAVYEFTYNDQSNIKDGASKAYIFRIGTSGWNHIHCNNSNIVAWAPGSWQVNDTGSAWKLTKANPTTFASLTGYEVYHSSTAGLTYTGTRTVFGKRNATPYIILASGGAEITKEHLDPNTDIESVTVTTPADTYIKEIVVVKDNEYSPAPINGEWAPGTKWFTIRNHRKGDFISVSNAAMNDSYQLKWGASARPTDAEGMWCFVEDGANGIRIYNKAYGPDFVLQVTGRNTNDHLVMAHLSEADATNSHFHFVKSNHKYNGNDEVCIIQGTSGGVGINDIGSNYPGVWASGESNHVGDQGSAFYIQRVDQATVDATTDYTAYKVRIQPEGFNINLPIAFAYSPTSEMGSKTTNHTSEHFILLQKDVTPVVGNFTSSKAPEGFTECTLTNSSTSPSYNIITLTGEITMPMIVHRTPWTVDKVNSTTNVPPANTGFLQKDLVSKGMKENPNTGTRIQNVPVFEMTEYIKPGSSKRIWLPTCNTNGSNSSLWSYQRWYNYRTEGMVDPDIYNFNALKPNGALFGNGYVTGAIYGDFIGKDITVNLPLGTENYDLALDHSRFEDYKKNHNTNGDLLEPTISQRVIYHLVDANVMAEKLENVANDEYLENYTIHFPSKKMGSKDARNGFDVIGLEQTFGNYWYYANAQAKTDKNPTQVTSKNDFSFNVTCSDPDVNISSLGVGVLEKNNNTMPSALNLQLPSTFSSQRFIMFNYPASRQFADKTELVIEVSVHGKRVAKFTLIFDDGTEPLPILDVLGKNSDGTHKSPRSTSAMIEKYGQPIAKVTFDAPEIPFQFPTGMTTSNLSDNTYNWATANNNRYGLPVANEYTDYSFFGGGGSGNNQYMAMGEYRLESSGNGTSGRAKIRPIEEYERVLGDESHISSPGYKQYFAFADVSEMPGKIISLPFSTTLCAGQRIYMQGWVGSATSANDNGQQQSGVILNVYGIIGNKRTLIYSYCPGIISSASEIDGVLYKSVENDYSGYRQSVIDNNDWNNQGYLIWNQVNGSFLIDGVTSYDSYLLEVDNNSYSSTGCDVVVDNFCVFVNPPKGNVDFTTPLCSDKTRHAKVHADYDMLKNLSAAGVNDVANPDWQITASYCFVDSVMFDNYVDSGIGVPTKELFEKDENGNHSLKPGLTYTDAQIATAINNAFNHALVGRRCTKHKKDAEGVPYEDHGFHSYFIDKVFENIPVYSYVDSRPEVIYRETSADGVRRIVFKEDVVRGEMEILKDESDGNRQYYPHMRPSRTYYLVFAPRYVDEESLKEAGIKIDEIATEIFRIETSCAYLGTFTTKDPMHVILDNADIESDLPITAVCNGETAYFSFDMPALKVDKPIIDEAYCISDQDLDGKLVPSSHGTKHYRYEPVFNTPEVSGVIKNLPYDWWFGGKYSETVKYRGTIEEYTNATHPTIKYDHNTADPSHKHTHAEDYKKHGEPIDISLAMEDFRFYYPDFGKPGNTDWNTLETHDYDNDSGYSLLQSEINAIRDFVERGIIVLHRSTLDMPMTYEEAEELQIKELNEMMENEMNTQILALALELNDETIKHLLPLKQLEGTILDMLSPAGKRELTFEEYASLSHDQLRDIAETLRSSGKLDITSEQIGSMSESELHKAVETVLRAMTDTELGEFAKANFPDIGHEKRAYLVIRALNLLSKEVVAKLTPEEQQSTTITRAKLREMMITIFSQQRVEVLRKMWKDTSAKLTEEERAALLEDKENPGTKLNPETMDAAGLAVLVEDALAMITNKMIADMMSDKYVHFTLIPIMPSQVNFVDEPYIFCPDPRGVKLRVTSKTPVMLDGFADMPYPAQMTNVPVRLGLKQIKETIASASKTLRIPVRGLKYAIESGVKAVRLAENTGYYNNLFLVKTNDPSYKQPGAAADTDGLTEAQNTDGTYRCMAGTIESMQANYPVKGQPEPDNYLLVKFKDDMKFREGYTYRIGINFMEHDKDDNPTIACFGTMLLDLKIVPEYQKWTAAVSNDWNNDQNWARADRTELNADNTKAGDVIEGSTDITVAADYPTNEDNQIASAFVPMYFTNVLFDSAAPHVAELYNGITPASRNEKKFLTGLKSSATNNIVYEMEVVASTGAWHTSGNYECGLFGTYIANGVTFTPGAQLGNAHYLNYKKAWVEYELDANRWYTIASPLKKSVAGDWYSPTAGGKQMTPHFYDIKYSTANNDRFRPAYYQRSWDRGGNNVVYEKSGGSYDSYVKADWSDVYNDAAVGYSAGGFSVKAELDYMASGDRPADGKVLVRMPKADDSYTYYDVNGSTGQAANAQIGSRAESSRLLSDDLLADGSGSISMTVSNATADNNYLLLSNPFMAAMDMSRFFEVNTDLEEKYWIVDADRQVVSVRTAADGEWITTGTASGRYVAPLQGFFVKKKSGVANQNSVRATYDASMQTILRDQEIPVLRARSRVASASRSDVMSGIIRLTAQRDGASSTAVIMLSDGADDAFRVGEDCEAMIDGNLYDHPTIYTSAGAVAQTINVRQSLNMLPVGLVSADDSEATVTFNLGSGVSRMLYLYDREDDSYTDIHDGTEVTMSGNNAGRYFLTSSIEDKLNAVDHKTVKEGVWTLSGTYCGTSVKGLAPGVYIVDGVRVSVR